MKLAWSQDARLVALTLLLLGLGGGLSQLVLADDFPSRFEFTGLLSLVLCLPILMRWQLGVYLYFLYLPFAYWVRRVYLLVDPSKGVDPLVLVPDLIFMLMATGFFLFNRKALEARVPEGERGIRYTATFFAAFCVLQIFNPFMNSITTGINGFRQFPMYLALLFIFPAMLTGSKQAWHWVKLLGLTSALAALYGAYQSLVGLPAYDALWMELASASHQQIGGTLRAFSTFSFTSTFSHYTLVGILAGLALVGTREQGRGWTLLAPLLAAASLWGLALTFVRSSYLAFLTAWLCTLILAGAPKWRLPRLTAVLLIGGLAFSVVSPSAGENARASTAEISTTQLVVERAATLTASTRTHSYGYRMGLWGQILKLSFVVPQGLGLGVGAGGKVGGNQHFQALAYSESQVFSVLAELGWVGLLAFLTLCGQCAWYTLRLHEETQRPELQLLLRFSLGTQVGLFVVGISGGPVLYTLPGAPCYWGSVGLALAVGRWIAQGEGAKHLNAPQAWDRPTLPAA